MWRRENDSGASSFSGKTSADPAGTDERGLVISDGVSGNLKPPGNTVVLAYRMRPVRVRASVLAVAACAATALFASASAGAFSLGTARAGGKLIAAGRAAPDAVSDGDGGVIVSARDVGDGVAVVNRFGPAGAPLWDQGIAFPDAAGVALASDGNGGAVVAIQHPESPTMTVGRILHSGATTWQARFPAGAIVSGGDGGAWVISQAGEIFADGIDAAGGLRPRLQITTSSDTESLPVAIGDGHGGAFLAWRAAVTETQFALRLQHLASDGTLWAAPAEVAGSSESSMSPHLASDGRGGVIVSWQAAGLLWIHDYSAAGRPVWDRVVTVPASDAAVAAVAADDGAVFVAWSRRLRAAPMPVDLLHLSFVGTGGALHWTRNVATVDGGVLDIRLLAGGGAATVAWQSASLPVVGPALDPDLSIYRATAGGAETYPANRRTLANSLGPDGLGALVHGGGGSVVAVFTQTPCFRTDVTGVAMQRIASDGSRSFAADGACP